MQLDILSSKPYPSVIQGFIAYLIKDSELKDLCGKKPGILSFCSAKKNGNIIWGKMSLSDILTAMIRRMGF